MDYEKIAYRLLDLQGEITKLINIERVIALPRGSKHHYENDVEHSYSLAMIAWYMCQHVPELDKNTVIQYALVHDMVEIHAGDVMAIGRTDAQQAQKDEREAKAIKQIAADWPDFNDMSAAIHAYESQSDDEAVFVKTLDKICGMLVNIQAQGKIWHEEGIERGNIIKNKDEKTKPHTDVHEIWKVLRQHILDHDEYFSPGKAS